MKHAFGLVVVRHGRTAWNAGGRFQGETDNPLDDVGRAQARALGIALAHERFTLAVASDMQRAAQTAAFILGERGPTVETDARWREIRFGVWEGLTWPQIVERDPALGELSLVKPHKPQFYTPEGGESFDELCTRIASAVEALDARVEDGGNVLVATHAGPLHALLRVVLGEADANALGVRFAPASVTRFTLGPDGNHVVDLNRTVPQEAAS